jgi:hypothetical protein
MIKILSKILSLTGKFYVCVNSPKLTQNSIIVPIIGTYKHEKFLPLVRRLQEVFPEYHIQRIFPNYVILAK